MKNRCCWTSLMSPLDKSKLLVWSQSGRCWSRGYLRELEGIEHGNTCQCWERMYQRENPILFMGLFLFHTFINTLKHKGTCWLAGVGKHCSYRKRLGYKMEMRTGVREMVRNSAVQNAMLCNSSVLVVVIMRKCLRRRKI